MNDSWDLPLITDEPLRMQNNVWIHRMASLQPDGSFNLGHGTGDYNNDTSLAQNEGMLQIPGSHHRGRGGPLNFASGRIASPHQSSLGFGMNARNNLTTGISRDRGMLAGQHRVGRGMGTPMIQSPGNVAGLITGEISMNSYTHADEISYQLDTSI